MPVDKNGRFYVVGSVPLLHPEAQTVHEMLEGWRNQQLCRNLAHDTIEARIRLVERFLAYTNEFPWTPGSMASVQTSRVSSFWCCRTLRVFPLLVAITAAVRPRGGVHSGERPR